MQVCLIETWCPESHGSMRRYGDLIAEAFSGDSQVQIVRHRVGLSSSQLRRYPRLLTTPLRHASVWRGVKRQLPQADLYHITDGSFAYLANTLFRRTTLVTIHDLIPYLQQLGKFSNVPPPSFFSRFVINRNRSAIGKAAFRIAVSYATAADLEALVGCKRSDLAVVYPPLSTNFLSEATESQFPLGKHGPANDGEEETPFILHLGNNAFYKNRAGVIEAFALLRKQFAINLVMAGPRPDPGMQHRVEELGLVDHVRFVVDPSDSEVGQLYRRAELLLFPSLYEGFGWPPLEAMASGCPVVSGDRGSLSEVVGEGAIVVDSLNHQGLADACLRVLTEPGLRDELIQKGAERSCQFTIDRFHHELNDVYQSLRS